MPFDNVEDDNAPNPSSSSSDETMKTRNEQEATPLAAACARGATLREIRALLKRSPASIIRSSCHARNVLHLAAAFPDTRQDVVEFLLAQRPQLAQELDAKGQSPLHVACRGDTQNRANDNNRHVSLKVIQLVYEAWRGAVALPDGDGLVPLLVAHVSKAPTSLVRFLASRETITTKTSPATTNRDYQPKTSTTAKQIIKHLATELRKQHNEMNQMILEFLIQLDPQTLALEDAESGSTLRDILAPLNLQFRSREILQRYSFIPRRQTNPPVPSATLSERTRTKPTDQNKHKTQETQTRRGSKRPRPDSILDEPGSVRATTNEMPSTGDNLGNTLVKAICQHETEQVRRLIHLHPQLVHARDSHGCLPIHWACHQKAPAAILHLLVSAWPHSLREKDHRGCLPLHLACGRATLVDQLKLLVTEYPQALVEFSYEGMLPIHYACRDEAPLEAIAYLVSHRPSTMWKRTLGICIHNGFLPFHFLCIGNSFDNVLWMIKQDPKVAKEANGDGSLPLHLLSRNPRATVELITILLEQHPISLSHENKEGMTPGDVASKVNNIEVANILDDLRCAKKMSQELEKVPAELPLHHACSNSQVPIDQVKSILKERPDEVCVPDGEGLLPIHVACRAGASFEVIKLLANDYPESLEWTNKGGSLPLHTACSNRASLEIVKFLIHCWPDAVEVANNFGWLPLHCACAYGASLEVIRLLALQYPEGVKRTTYTHGDDPLHLASSGKTSLDVIKWLVEFGRDEISKKNSAGETALDKAMFSHASRDIVNFLSLL